MLDVSSIEFPQEFGVGRSDPLRTALAKTLSRYNSAQLKANSPGIFSA